MKLDTILAMLPAIGPVVAALPAFKKAYDEIVATFNEKDQYVLRAAYVDLMSDNDAGHARLQEKLKKAQG